MRKSAQNQFNERLATGGYRLTAQREHVYKLLVEKRDHPTAEEVFLRAKQTMPEISLATVYNCLDALVVCGLVRQVNFNRGASRFCPRMEEHCHFYCDRCGSVFDIEMPRGEASIANPELPDGFSVSQSEVSFRGVCSNCALEAKRV